MGIFFLLRDRETESERGLPAVDLLPQMPAASRAARSQSQKPELSPGLPQGWQCAHSLEAGMENRTRTETRLSEVFF